MSLTMRPISCALAILVLVFCQSTTSLSLPKQELHFVDGPLRQRDNVPAPGPPPAQTDELDPEDFSGIKQIVAIGDSYSAGIGAGGRTDWSCSRYDHSYPALLVQDERLASASFQFLSCSGATSIDVLNKQVPKMKGSIDTLMLSAGGNDVGLVDLLNACIFGWKLADYSQAGCEKTISNTQDLIDNTLPGALDELLTAAKAKLTPGTGRLYYTAYAQFFDESDTQCDNVYWNFYPLDPYKQALNTARRVSLNTLARNVNSAIQAAATRAGPQIVFVNYDSYYTDFMGRFCEAGITEPAPERQELLFFERYTTNPDLPWKVKRDTGNTLPAAPPVSNAQDSNAQNSNAQNSNQNQPANPAAPVASIRQALPPGARSSEPATANQVFNIDPGLLANQSAAIQSAESDPNNLVANGTFEGEIAQMIQSTLQNRPSWVSSLENGVFEELIVSTPPADGSAPHILAVTTPGNGTTTSARRRRGFVDTVAWLISDDVKRVFHPQPNGHAVIATLVLFHMEEENAKMQAGIQVNSPVPANFASNWTEVVMSPSCSFQAPDVSAASLDSSGVPAGCSQSCWQAYQTCYQNSDILTLSKCLKSACGSAGCNGCTVCNLPF